MSRVRILNSDKEVTAVKFNLKEQRCLQKNLVTLDAEASYSVKLIDMENRGMKVFYRRFRDKVSKIRSHLKLNEISNLRDLEATGRLSPPQNTVNTTATLRIADAEKRLKLQGREHLRKTKSAFTSRSLVVSNENSVDSVVSRSYDSHLNGHIDNVSTQKRPSTIAWDSKLNCARESIPSRRHSKNEPIEMTKSKVNNSINKEKTLNKTENETIDHIEAERHYPSCNTVSIVYGEENPVIKPENSANVFSLSPSFIETGNMHSPRIINKTKEEETVTVIPELTVTETEDSKTDNNVFIEETPSVDSALISDKDSSAVDSNHQIDATESTSNRKDSIKSSSGTDVLKEISSETNQVKSQCINEPKHIRIETGLKQDDHKSIHRDHCLPDKSRSRVRSLNTKVGESPRSVKSYSKYSTPRVNPSKRTPQCKSARGTRLRDKSTNSSPERRSFSAVGKMQNFAQITKQYSCHNYDKARISESRASFSINDGLFCFGDDPYEERRQIMIMDEHNRFVILLHRKEEYLERIEEYIRQQMLESTTVKEGQTEDKRGKSPKDIWDELKKCRYLRKDDGEEEIDLSTVVTLASDQLKNKQNLKYKPLFQKQKSKKTIIVEPEETTTDS